MIVLFIAFAVYSWGGSHSQDWNCLGPQPSVSGPCVKHEPGRPDERR